MSYDDGGIDNVCEQCGLSLEWISCWSCFGEGGYHDCGEDCCCCLEPDEDLNIQCDVCEGEGGWLGCEACAEKSSKEHESELEMGSEGPK